MEVSSIIKKDSWYFYILVELTSLKLHIWFWKEDPEDSHEAEKIHESKSNAPKANKRKPELRLNDNNGKIKKAKEQSTENMTRPTSEERYYPLSLAESKRNLPSKCNDETTSASTSRRQKELKEKSVRPRRYKPSESDNSQKRLKQQKLLIEAENKGVIHKMMDKGKVHQSTKLAQKIVSIFILRTMFLFQF